MVPIVLTCRFHYYSGLRRLTDQEPRVGHTTQGHAGKHQGAQEAEGAGNSGQRLDCVFPGKK